MVRLFLIAYLVLLAGLMWFEESLVYFPTKFPAGDWQPPGLTFEDAEFAAADGPKLHGWYVPASQARATILLAHGNGGNLTHRIETLREMHRRRVNILVFDYRGYGKSEGSPSEAGILADARAARAWLARREGIAESEIVLLGESLGGGVAVDLAALDGARGLILLNTFASLPDVAGRIYWWLPVKLLMRNQLDSLAKIPRYQGPLLQIHGDSDTTVPYDSAQKLFAAANEPKTLITVRGADHNNQMDRATYDAIDRYLDELPPLKTTE